MAKQKIRILEIIAFFAAMGIFGIHLDGFWHLTKGRETFFSLPHLFVYLGAIGVVWFSYKGYRLTKDRVWKWLFAVSALIPIGAPIDEIWHRVVGKETIESVLILWSPPHLLFLFAGLFGLMILTLIIRGEKSYKKRDVLGSIVLGLFLALLLLTIEPIAPFGPHQILGTSGIGIWFACLFFTLQLSKKLFPTFSASITGLVALVPQLMVYNSSLYLNPQDAFFHMPVWLEVFMFMAPATLIDFLPHEMDNMIKGSLLGIGMALFYYIGISSIPNNPYVFADIWISVITMGIGGIIAGLVHDFLKLRGTEETTS
ncbi:MAG TPA: hypothetical protein VEC17_01630 [Candidatus Binatia bacterium]|nr:hypothetical protein [Candidatus Binatia bacterium]